MDTVKMFYHDKFGREIAYVCADRELGKFINDFLEDNIDKGHKLYYTYKNDTKELCYYNFNMKDLW